MSGETPNAVPRCFRVHPADNVGTLLDDADGPGTVRVIGGEELPLRQAAKLGHKIALNNIADGEAVTKFGVPIGRASGPIRQGDWVHLHNCVSNFDARSGTLDLHTGAATDTRYE